MRLLPVASVFLLALFAVSPALAANHPLLSSDQAMQLVLLVARHDHIDTRDTHIEVNSMDLGASFIHGFASFIIIRESLTQGPDETLRRYAVNRRTGDVWEMTLCTHYSFPELERARRTMTGRDPGVGADGLAAQQKALGCRTEQTVPMS